MIYALLKITFAMLFSIVFRAKIEGRENMPKEGPVILAANHMSNWDPPLLATFLSRPVSYMAKQELFFNFIADYILRSCHSFPVKRGAADRGAIKAALAELKNGRCLGVFPQGTRSRHGEEEGGAWRRAARGHGESSRRAGRHHWHRSRFCQWRLFAEVSRHLWQTLDFSGKKAGQAGSAGFFTKNNG